MFTVLNPFRKREANKNETQGLNSMISEENLFGFKERNLIEKINIIQTRPMKIQSSFDDREFDFREMNPLLIFKIFPCGLDQKEKIKLNLEKSNIIFSLSSLYMFSKVPNVLIDFFKFMILQERRLEFH